MQKGYSRTERTNCDSEKYKEVIMMKTDELLLLIAFILIIFNLGGQVYLQTKEITLSASAGVAIIILYVWFRRRKSK
jgi:hypothetical protein